MQSRLVKLGSAITLVFGLLGASYAAPAFVEGTDYKVVPVQGPLEVAGKIEVREFFWYGCSHCYALEPYVAKFKSTLPSDVNFVRTPAAINPTWEQNARGFYAIELMGKLNATHTALFDAIHKNDMKLFDQASLSNFYARYGIKQNTFNSLYNSFAVTGKVQKSKNLAIMYRITGVPSMIVNGKYVVQGEGQRSIDTVNYLIGLERARLGMTKAKKAA